jgi:hypothetical protein
MVPIVPGRSAFLAAQYGGFMRSELNANLKGGTMIGKTRLLVLTLTIAMSVPAYAEEKFEKLKAQQIRTRGYRRRSLV